MLGFVLVTLVPPAALAAALAVPLGRLARARGLVAGARPDRAHTKPTPLAGGLAIAAALAVTGAAAWAFARADLAGWLPDAARGDMAAGAPGLERLALGAALFFIIGLLDDRYELKPEMKLALQLVSAATVVVGFGLGATAHVPWPGVAAALSVLWLVAVVNAVNLFDHADGLVGAWAVASCTALAAGQLVLGERTVAAGALATAGAAAGFLVHNRPRARLFLGDAGSHLVGYLVAALALAGRYWMAGRTTRLAVLVPAALVALPVADAAVVTVLRLARGQRPWVGDATSHLGHRLAAKGLGPVPVAQHVAAACVVVAAASLPAYSSAAWVAGAGLGTAALVTGAFMAWSLRGRKERTDGG